MNAGPRRRRLRTLVVTAVCVGLAGVPGCGTCLLLVTKDVALETEGGATVHARVTFRPEGLFEERFVLRDLLSSPLYEILDLFILPIQLGRCAVRDDLSIEGGPFGLLAAVGPLATLTGNPYALFLFPGRVDAVTLERLRSPAPDERRSALRSVFPRVDVRDITFR